MLRSSRILKAMIVVVLAWSTLIACTRTDYDPVVVGPDAGAMTDAGNTSGRSGNSTSGTTSGGNTSNRDLEQCRRRFLAAATRNDSVWWGLRCTMEGRVTYGLQCGSQYEVEQFFFEFRADGTYFLNYRYHPDYQDDPASFGGFCRIPRFRNGLKWEMADCDTVRLYTGCGDTELVEIQGDTMRYDSRHGYVELDRWRRENLTMKFYRNPLKVGGCWDKTEPRCQ